MCLFVEVTVFCIYVLCVHSVCSLCVFCVSPFPCWLGHEKGACDLTTYLSNTANSTFYHVR